MEPTASVPGAGGLGELRIDSLRRSVEIYLGIAYPSGNLPELIRRRLAWPEGSFTESTLSRPPFERAGRAADGSTNVYALRLGNARYPHMKLQIQPWPNEAGFLLSVNTHDQVAGLDVGAADVQAFRDLQAENQRLKEAIEAAWEAAGLPTFLQYLRAYIQSHAESPEVDDSTPSTGRDATDTAGHPA
ncbi:hypothetical protein [Aquisphaera insulae]|uniref:hypothetical protein n=1 Tax=Aquisphaera insulae TaxID=2712864 RepID=UPI00196BA240|nr:hypothetical protein [Aquisphaera insulae]